MLLCNCQVAAALADAAAGAVHSAAAAHDAWLTSREPAATLKVPEALKHCHCPCRISIWCSLLCKGVKSDTC